MKRRINLHGLYGKVTKCFHDKGFAFIYGEDGNSYFAHYSLLNGEKIEKGDYVFFVPFRNDRSDYNARSVSVIYTQEKEVKENRSTHKKKNNRKHKSCNADKVIRDDVKFQRFVRKFMYEQRILSRERMNNGTTH